MTAYRAPPACGANLALGLLEQTHQALLGGQDGVTGRQAAHVVVHGIQLPLLWAIQRDRARDGGREERGKEREEERGREGKEEREGGRGKGRERGKGGQKRGRGKEKEGERGREKGHRGRTRNG